MAQISVVVLTITKATNSFENFHMNLKKLECECLSGQFAPIDVLNMSPPLSTLNLPPSWNFRNQFPQKQVPMYDFFFLGQIYARK